MREMRGSARVWVGALSLGVMDEEVPSRVEMGLQDQEAREDGEKPKIGAISLGAADRRLSPPFRDKQRRLSGREPPPLPCWVMEQQYTLFVAAGLSDLFVSGGPRAIYTQMQQSIYLPYLHLYTCDMNICAFGWRFDRCDIVVCAL